MYRQRKNIRLQSFDYSSANAYFITICVKNFTPAFGEIRKGIVRLSEVGNTAAVYLQNIPELRSEVLLDEFIIMPNHLHCILEITCRDLPVANPDAALRKYGQPVACSISVIINQYKGAVKKWCNHFGYSDFQWQSRFHDHVIRSEKEFQRIQNYIISNPTNWHMDKYRL